MFNQRISKIGVILLLFWASWARAGTTPSSATAVNIELIPESPFVNLSYENSADGIRESRVSVHVVISGATAKFLRPIEIYACLPTEEGLRSAANSSTLSAASLRIRNDHGEWVALEPLPELQGRRGVRIAVINSSANILLSMQLQVAPRQAAGRYQGVLMLQAQERQ